MKLHPSPSEVTHIKFGAIRPYATTDLMKVLCISSGRPSKEKIY